MSISEEFPVKYDDGALGFAEQLDDLLTEHAAIEAERKSVREQKSDLDTRENELFVAARENRSSIDEVLAARASENHQARLADGDHASDVQQ